MIARDSRSYPVRGAALFAGVDYGRALAWVDARDEEAAFAASRAILNADGVFAWAELYDLLAAAWNRGDLIIRRWSDRTPDGDAR